VLDGAGDLLEEVSDALMQYEWHFEPLAESGGGAPNSPADAGFPDVPDYPNGE
jgi:hypothetical protein